MHIILILLVTEGHGEPRLMHRFRYRSQGAFPCRVNMSLATCGVIRPYKVISNLGRTGETMYIQFGCFGQENHQSFFY